MKKTVIIAVMAILAATLSASAQVKIGPRAGIAASWIPGTNLDPYDKVLPHNSFYAGVSAEWEFAEDFVAQAELLYSGKGHSDRNYPLGLQEYWGTRYSLELGYLQLPVYFGYKFMDGQISLMAGPEFGYNVVAKSRKAFNTAIEGYTKKEPIREDVRKAIRPFNIGLGLQLDYEFIDGLGLTAKLSWGLNRTFRDGMNASGNILDGLNDRGHNTSIQIGLFYKFAL